MSCDTFVACRIMNFVNHNTTKSSQLFVLCCYCIKSKQALNSQVCKRMKEC